MELESGVFSGIHEDPYERVRRGDNEIIDNWKGNRKQTRKKQEIDQSAHRCTIDMLIGELHDPFGMPRKLWADRCVGRGHSSHGLSPIEPIFGYIS